MNMYLYSQIPFIKINLVTHSSDEASVTSRKYFRDVDRTCILFHNFYLIFVCYYFMLLNFNRVMVKLYLAK